MMRLLICEMITLQMSTFVFVLSAVCYVSCFFGLIPHSVHEEETIRVVMLYDIIVHGTRFKRHKMPIPIVSYE